MASFLWRTSPMHAMLLYEVWEYQTTRQKEVIGQEVEREKQMGSIKRNESVEKVKEKDKHTKAWWKRYGDDKGDEKMREVWRRRGRETFSECPKRFHSKKKCSVKRNVIHFNDPLTLFGPLETVITICRAILFSFVTFILWNEKKHWS